jgi:hypothetical protein
MRKQTTKPKHFPEALDELIANRIVGASASASTGFARSPTGGGHRRKSYGGKRKPTGGQS